MEASNPYILVKAMGGNDEAIVSIQGNWRETLKTRTGRDLALIKVISEELCLELNLPFIDTFGVFRREPIRFKLFFGLAHWNQRGMPVLARTFLCEIEKLDWWRCASA